VFDGLLDEMRTHSTQWLETRRLEVIDAQRELVIPHGTRVLVGNPNLPDGLQLFDAADLPPP